MICPHHYGKVVWHGNQCQRRIGMSLLLGYTLAYEAMREWDTRCAVTLFH